MKYEPHPENKLDDLTFENNILRRNVYNLQDQLQVALKKIDFLIDTLEKQQAMPDDSWKKELKNISLENTLNIIHK